MQISLGRKGDYSVRAVLDLARAHGARRRKAREIAAAMDLPGRYVPQILANLVRHGILTAVAGPDGGYALARDPDAISLLEVVEAAEGPVARTECVLRSGPCDRADVCALHDTWGDVQSAAVDQLRRATFADLAAVDAAIEAGEYRPRSGVAAHPSASPRRGLRDTPSS